MRWEDKWERRIERAGAKCVGIVVRIHAHRANDFWGSPRSKDEIGSLAVITGFTRNVAAYGERYNGASFDLRYGDGKETSALIEEIRV
jgi:hypothetical protein